MFFEGNEQVQFDRENQKVPYDVVEKTSTQTKKEGVCHLLWLPTVSLGPAAVPMPGRTSLCAHATHRLGPCSDVMRLLHHRTGGKTRLLPPAPLLS